MRYRAINEPKHIEAAANDVVRLVGEDEYFSLLTGIGKGLRNKGYVTEMEDLRFGLELQLMSLELQRRSRQIARGVSREFHEGLDFLLGVSQTIAHLSERGKNELRGKIIGGLKTSGLRPLHHEFRVAAQLSNDGLDVTFNDLEKGGGFDFTTSRRGQNFEVEAKCVASYMGQPIHPIDVDNLFAGIRSDFEAWKDRENYPIFLVRFKDRLPKAREDHSEIIQQLNLLASSLGRQLSIESDRFVIEHTATITKRDYIRMRKLAASYDVLSRGVVYIPVEHPRVIVRLASNKRDKFFKNMTGIMSETAKKQLSGANPSVIWAHIDYLSERSFEFYSMSNSAMPLFEMLASAVFDSEKRRHVTQVVFSGAGYLKEDGQKGSSSFQRTVFNSPYWSGELLFDGGRQRRKRRPNEIDWRRIIKEWPAMVPDR